MSFATFLSSVCLMLLLIQLQATEGDANRVSEGVQGLEVIETPLPWYDSRANLVFARPREMGEDEMRVILSRDRYWVEDGHLDVVVEFGGDREWVDSTLVVRIGADSQSAANIFEFSPPGGAIAFNPPLPEAVLGSGGGGWISVEWQRREREPVIVTRLFRAESVGHGVSPSGSISIEMPNPLGVSGVVVPQTVGVPFPRGVLWDTRHLRLVGPDGREVAIQVRETARWSRYGSVKWVLLDFVDDAGEEGTALSLHYGPDVQRSLGVEMRVEQSAGGYPFVDAGVLKWDDGLHYTDLASGATTMVLAPAAISGGYVERIDGTVYTMPRHGEWTVEECGPVKVVLARRGWFESGDVDPGEFNQFISRWIIYRDSPLAQLFHTWIYTGNSDREEDQIQAMGWCFPAPEGESMQSPAFLLGDRQWVPGSWLLQYDHDAFELAADDSRAEITGSRFGGVTRGRVGDAVFYVAGVDFWQNFPSEIGWLPRVLEWNQWPRKNRPATTAFDSDKIEGQSWILSFLQARFAHEGEALDFRVPQFEQLEAEIRKGGGGTGGIGQQSNAQGISHTSELWLYFSEAEGGDAGLLLEAMEARQLAAFVDPWWAAQTGVFYEMHPRDPLRFPEMEEAYAAVFRAPSLWAERLGIYGKWVYGDVPAWIPNLAQRQPALYRAYRKAHHAWPLPWEGFARSGDPELRKILEASTRQMIDVNFSHFHDGEIAGGGIGIWNVGPLPWAADSEVPVLFSIHNKVDYLWSAYYLTGYQRARDNALVWAAEAKSHAAEMPSLGGGVGFRTPANLMKTFLETYEATFDPWFLVAAHSVAEGHQLLHQNRSFDGSGFYGHYSGDREFHRYSGSIPHREYYKDYADNRGLRSIVSLEANAYAWQLFKDPVYLRNLASLLGPANLNIYLGDEPEYMTGYFLNGSTATGIATSFFLRNVPAALHALAQVEAFPQETLLEFNIQAPAQVLIRPPANQSAGLVLRSIPPGVARPWGDGELHYAIRDEEEREIYAGTFEIQHQQAGEILPGVQLELPRAESPVTYSLTVQPMPRPHWTRSLVLPVAPEDVPEVLVAERGAPLHLGRESTLWFLVPGGVESFNVQYTISIGQPQMLSIWNPDGRRVVREEFLPAQQPVTHSYTIDVAAEFRDRLWRIVLPLGGQLLIDEQIPPYFSVTPAKWFMPEPPPPSDGL